MKPIKTQGFECECETIYKTREECKDCCSKEEPEVYYRCAYCDAEYQDEYEAQDCCDEEYAPQVQCFECSECGELYEDEDEAKECCK